MQYTEEIKNHVVNNIKSWINEIYQSDPQLNENFSLYDHIQSKLTLPRTEAEIWFIDKYEKTFENYAKEVRVNKVKELLVYTNLDLPVIARKLGYFSVKIMSADLMQVTGLPISFFQNIKQQKEDTIKRQRI
ncbi:hypothetical protein DVR12_15580 [Chitinophaga silvatica]|uniref:HTH araC/xylS-type domain-containing protein n=2 Tax=Chitinophaga silvatica TaxID=2282649 RepID=A0A3E1Y807_9BACT|nr:hypothetical protein DVR12_15580 [Chitinophaga silvatica]